MILLLLSGSALAVNWADAHVPAILQAWYPGAQGGAAIAEVLFGDRCPQGKLPVTFYRSCDDLPDFSDYSMRGRTYRYMDSEPLYPFGYGLSYTSFSYTDVQAPEVLSENGVEIQVSVKNTGTAAGTETVQVYVKICREKTPNAQLKGLLKVALAPGEEKTVTVALPYEAFGLYDGEGRMQVESGKAEVFVGGQAPGKRSEELTGQAVTKLSVRIP